MLNATTIPDLTSDSVQSLCSRGALATSQPHMLCTTQPSSVQHQKPVRLNEAKRTWLFSSNSALPERSTRPVPRFHEGLARQPHILLVRGAHAQGLGKLWTQISSPRWLFLQLSDCRCVCDLQQMIIANDHVGPPGVLPATRWGREAAAAPAGTSL